MLQEFLKIEKRLEAVKNISFTVNKGEVVGLLGENGAGKTTLLRMICTILEPTSGTILINGQDIHKNPMSVKREIGVLFGSETGLYDRLTARENLKYFAKLYGISSHETDTKIEKLAVRFGMKNYLDRKVG